MKVNWGSVLVDIAFIAAAAYTREWWFLWGIMFTGSYEMDAR